MKTLWVVVGICLAINQGNAQKINGNDVRANIKNGLQQNYGVKDADWEKEGENYEASFDQKGKKVSVLYNATGSILETEKEISKNELPKAVLDLLKKDYAGFELDEAARIESKGVITYEAELEKGKQSVELIFDAQGKLIKKKQKKMMKKIDLIVTSRKD